MDRANAHPRKQFFLEMFTRDISLEDCILDLIDNSIDSLLKTRKIDIESLVLLKDQRQGSSHVPARVKIDYSAEGFKIEDDCGGIAYEEARNDVFRFGAPPKPVGRLGVYGVGLKRAIFKLGNRVTVESHTAKNGFRMTVNLAEWAVKDDALDDWTLPLEKLPGVAPSKTGTTISVTELHEEVVARLRDPTLERSLASTIGHTYTVFLASPVRLSLNGTVVRQKPLPFGASAEVQPGRESFKEDGVSITLLVTLAPKGQWGQEIAGWYVLCNGRVVVYADKSELTGWGIATPAFHSKYRGFVGLALFTSDDPLRLPWTTSKRGVNRESLIYQRAKTRMAGLARPVINFLNNMYPSEPREAPVERDLASRVSHADFRLELRKPEERAFVAKARRILQRITRVQYDADPRELDRIRKRLRKPTMAATAIGRYTFDHFLKTECPND